jgi:hypothetical protein
MKPKYKSTMRQKQRKRARENGAESKESNKSKITSAERMTKLRKRRKAKTSGAASERGVASTSRAAQTMDIDTDSEQSTQCQTESTQYSTIWLGNSHDLTFVIHTFCYLCKKCNRNTSNFHFFSHFYTHLHVFTQKKASVVSLKWYRLHFFQFHNLYKVGMTSWTGDQPVARPLPTHRINAGRHSCLERHSNQRSQCSSGEDGSCLRTRGHCDRHI